MFQATKNGRRAWLALSRFYGGTAEHTRKMVLARSTLETLTWSNESSFKLNNFATQLVDHYETLDRGGQPRIDEEKVMKLLNSKNTSNGFLLTRIELNHIGVTFANTIVDISTSVAQIFPLVNVKERKAIVLQVGTNSDTTYSTHVNGIEFTQSNCDKRLSNNDYKCLSKQVKKLIGFAKAYGYHDKQSASLAEKQKSNKIGMIKREEYHKFCTMDLPTMIPKRKWWNVPSARLYNISPRITHPMTTVLLMKAQNPMPMQDLFW